MVDGSEIRRSPVEVGSWNPIIYKVLYISTVFNSIIHVFFCVAKIMAGQPTPPNVPPPRNKGLIRPY